MKHSADTWLLSSTFVLIITGFLIFISASLGLLAREGASFSAIVFKQIFSGLILGGICLYGGMHIKYVGWKRISFWLFALSVLITVLVFIPHIGFAHGGARRWLALGPFSFQPAELLKLGYILYLGAWLSAAKSKINELAYGLIPFTVITGIVAALLLLQPDTGTFLATAAAGGAMLIVSGVPFRHIGALFLLAIACIGVLFIVHPYVQERFLTYLQPARDPHGSGYQIQQSLIAIGSGRMFGRGFGQSIQKFNYLPEPIGDSIFAVASEEFGFVGSTVLIILFATFAMRGLRIAARSPDTFSGLVAIGIVILILGQAFLNIGAMLGVFPLTGLPLPFVSQGGSALFLTLLEAGILLNISKYRKN